MLFLLKYCKDSHFQAREKGYPEATTLLEKGRTHYFLSVQCSLSN